MGKSFDRGDKFERSRRSSGKKNKSKVNGEFKGIKNVHVSDVKEELYDEYMEEQEF